MFLRVIGASYFAPIIFTEIYKTNLCKVFDKCWLILCKVFVNSKNYRFVLKILLWSQRVNMLYV